MPPRRRFLLRIGTLGPAILAGLVIAPVIVWGSYAPPKLLARDDLPALQGTPVDYDHTIRFLGYVDDAPKIQVGDLHRVTLCWEVLKPATQTAIFSLKIFDETGNEIGGRTSVHGMGHYSSSLWRPGDIFCDRVDVPIEGPLEPGRVYDTMLVLFDTQDQYQWQATGPDGAVIETPIIYQVISPAGDLSGTVQVAWQGASIAFPDLARLAGWSLEGTPGSGQSLRLTLLWDVSHETSGDWSVFVHLVGPSTALSLAGGPPVGGVYPTWAWTPGEKIVDARQIDLPADLPPGSYEVRIGFFNEALSERLPATQNGDRMPDDDALLFTFTVN